MNPQQSDLKKKHPTIFSKFPDGDYLVIEDVCAHKPIHKSSATTATILSKEKAWEDFQKEEGEIEPDGKKAHESAAPI